MKRDKKKPKIERTEPETLLEILTECGRLKNTIEQTLTVAVWSFPETNRSLLKSKLEREGTEEYNAYQEGKVLGDFDIRSALHKGARSGDTFAVEALSKIQTDEAVDKAVKDNFFPEE